MTPVVIVPGLGGSGETHWQTHLQRSLPNATRVQQDDWERPDLTRWVERLARTVEARRGVILVAHSLGCPLVAHLARQRPDLSIKGALLVAPADVDSARHTPGHTRGFAPIPLRPLPFRSIVVASRSNGHASWPPHGARNLSMPGRLGISTSRRASVRGPGACIW